MSHPAGVQQYDPQEFSEDLDDSHGEQRSLSFEESDMSIPLPRSQSRLDFFYEDNLNQSGWDSDDTVVPISRVRLPHSLYHNRAASSRDHDDEDDEGDPLFGLSITHYENSPACFEHQPASPPQPELLALDHAAPPQDQWVKISLLAPHIQKRRLDYPHHGFSRSAFLLHKSFWTARHEDWLTWQANEVRRRIDHDVFAHDLGNAYSGIVTGTQEVSGPPSQSRVSMPPSSLDRSFEEQASRGHAENSNAPIYPRVGDFSTLHDPRSERLDRCFFKLPLWTIQKTLYLFDMVYRASPTSSEMRPSASSRSLQSSTGPTTSGSEDITLVTDLFKKITLEDGGHQGSPPHNAPPLAHKTAYDWEVDWFVRWDVLVALIQQDEDKQQATPSSLSTALLRSMDDDSPPPRELPETPTQEAPMFHFASDDSDSDNEDDEDDDDDDDVGTLVMNPTYSKTFEEGYDLSVNSSSRNRGLRRGPRLRTV